MAASPGRVKEPREDYVTAWVSLLGFNVQETAPSEGYIQLPHFRDLRDTSPLHSTRCLGRSGYTATPPPLV